MSKLLIVDDEEDLRDVLVALLEDVASEIVTCTNGQEAIDLLQTRSFDAILSDEKMPKKTGMDILRWLRAANDQTPFVIHTGFGHHDMQVEAKNLGVFAFIDKPWDEKHLITTVENALKAKK